MLLQSYVWEQKHTRSNFLIVLFFNTYYCFVFQCVLNTLISVTVHKTLHFMWEDCLGKMQMNVLGMQNCSWWEKHECVDTCWLHCRTSPGSGWVAGRVDWCDGCRGRWYGPGQLTAGQPGCVWRGGWHHPPPSLPPYRYSHHLCLQALFLI